MKIPIDAILPNPEQPRQQFNQVDLKELAESIRINGLLNAIAVEDAGDGMYFILDGERRWRAHKLLGHTEIEATVHPPQNGGSEERLVKALVANMHRENLSPIEEAKAYKRLADLGKSNVAIAHYVGISGATLNGRLKLLELQPEIQDLIEAEKLSPDIRVTEALLSIRKPEDRVAMALRLARRGIKIKTIVGACRTFNQMLHRPDETLDIPSVDLARKRVKREISQLPAWSILKQANRLPPWLEYQEAANKTCMICSLKEFASESTCKECPAVMLTQILMEKADEHH